MSPQTLLQASPPLRRTVVLMVLIAILLFDWQPEGHLRPVPARRRLFEPAPLPEPSPDASPRGARATRAEAPRPLPGVRQAARRRTWRRA